MFEGVSNRESHRGDHRTDSLKMRKGRVPTSFSLFLEFRTLKNLDNYLSILTDFKVIVSRGLSPGAVFALEIA